MNTAPLTASSSFADVVLAARAQGISIEAYNYQKTSVTVRWFSGGKEHTCNIPVDHVFAHVQKIIDQKGGNQ